MTKNSNTANIINHSRKAIFSSPWKVNLHPLADFELKTIPLDIQARFVHIAELLEELGTQRVALQHIRTLEGKLWEVRVTGRDGIDRAVYAAIQGRRLLTLYVLIKKTQTTPRKAIKTALKRLD